MNNINFYIIKRKFQLMFLIFLSFFVLCFYTCSVINADEIGTSDINTWMPNKKFQSLVLDDMKIQGILSKDSTVNDITQQNMSKLQWISGQYTTNNALNRSFNTLSDNRGVDSYSIEGIQYATNIVALNLDNTTDFNDGVHIGDVTDISPISSLSKLKYIFLRGNRITDVSPIVQLQQSDKNLTYVDVSLNSIYDFKGMQLLPQQGIQETSRLYINGLNVGEGVHNRIMNPTIGEQVAVISDPLKINSENRSTTVNINDIAHLPSTYSISRVANLTQAIPFENIHNYRYVFPYISVSSRGANVNQINNTTFHYSNLPEQVMNPKLRLPGYGVIPLQYKYYIVLHNNDYDDSYYIPYVFVDNGIVHVNYVDANGNKLSDPTTLTGKIGDSYTTSAKDIPGYTLSKEPTNKTGKYSADDINVNYEYTKNPTVTTGTVHVNYVDANGNKLSDPTTLTGKIGDSYTTSAKDIQGYTLSKEPTNKTGKYGADDINVNYEYTKNPTVTTGTVHVNYVDANGNKLSDPTTLTGKVGDSYTTSAKDIPGYTLSKEPTNKTGKYGADDINVNYEYTKNPTVTTGTVHVNYVDANGNKLSDPTTLTGKIGDSYTTSAKDIQGYTLSKEPTNKTGKYGADDINVNYEYTKNPTVTTGTVHVNYVDANGNKLSDPTTLTGKVGDSYTTSAKDIPGYTLSKEPTNKTGKYGADDINVNYEYTKNPTVTTGTVHVNYVDANGNKLSDPTTLTGKIGDSYTTSAKDIPGYTLSKEPTNKTGKYDTDDVNVNYEYTKNSDNDNIPIIVNPSNHDAKNSDNNNIPHNHFRIDKNKTSKYHGLAICSIKYINMYSGLNNDLNNRSNIVASYIKKTRIKYPMFVVKGVYSYENREYYKVVDVNHKSKTNGLIGYITANKHYVIPAYLKSHTRFITVINPYGVYSSSNVKLNNNLKKYNQGSILKINGIVKHNLTTRYVLPNGNYITGNCRLIELGKRRIEKQIKLKKNVYLYKDMNLTHKLRMLKRGRTYNLRYYDYSYRYDFNKTGFKIYLIKGGYIKADSKAIKITKRY
ncbi:MucBP domain-containing protein [Apilactobacillus xinyiensis]|uniref:MucBP domain-containing protein n=1 Tax=Apilactobacillus xinyiensis TaxID=2841032 RepID=UPI00200DA084|nr:MucBP domain-containing protein [Apilactobacillus xinyiensis]MCL0318316.1 MucBP domain-containing protein [Apilactobacillus xinyiensis]